MVKRTLKVHAFSYRSLDLIIDQNQRTLSVHLISEQLDNIYSQNLNRIPSNNKPSKPSKAFRPENPQKPSTRGFAEPLSPNMTIVISQNA